MEANTNKKIEIKELTALQICNELKIIGYYRDFIYKKYKGCKFSSKDWKIKLTEDGLNVK